MSDNKTVSKGPIASTFANMVIVLAILCLVCGGLLALSNQVTKPLILEGRAAKITQSIAAVVPVFDNDPQADQFIGSDPSVTVFPARQAGQAVGWAIQTYTNKGYSGKITMMVGVNVSGLIQKVIVLGHAETPGLGSKMTEKSFAGQFISRDLAQDFTVRKDGGDVDAITASTITSRAYCDALNRAQAALVEAKAAAGDSVLPAANTKAVPLASPAPTLEVHS